jgi:crotonobetainyl-CoA:carnitine CoA-transferase CaiB-like acyl-CoA transferase
MRRTPLSREWAERGLAPGWQAINGNKRSLTLDLSKPEAIAIVKQLAAQGRRGDGEFPPRRDGQARHRLCALSAINPRLIYCAISGFRPDRPGTIGRRL